MTDQEILYAIALTRMTGFNAATALHLYRELGSARAVFDHRADVADVVSGCTPRLAKALSNWDDALSRAEAEMAFLSKYNVRALTPADADYPVRLHECDDAPLVLYYRGTANLNAARVVSIVGTRHATAYGLDLVRRFVTDLSRLCPGTLVVSGLAYGIDICAHRQALEAGLPTVGVLAHGLEKIYPSLHRQTAVQMVERGGLLTEYMSQSHMDKSNFVRRNRIVAGISDATVLAESAIKGGGLITAEIAQGYGRQVFAFPGAVGAPASEGCNHLIRRNGAALITSAQDFVEAMGWESAAQLRQAKDAGIERDLFPDLTDEERTVVGVLDEIGDLQQNILAVRTNIPIGQLTAILFQLEMKGVVKPLAGGSYHLLK